MSERTAFFDNRQPDGAGSVSFATLLSSHTFVLDVWQVYPTRNLIQHRQRHNDSRPLEPRLMRLLCLLAASADAVVTRDDIINTLWPRVVVNENSLTRAISDLRRVLTSDGDNRTALIQTIPKRGYRLTQAPEAIDTSCPTQQTLSPATPGTPWLTRWTPSIAACFILALALLTRVSNEDVSMPVVAQQPTTGIGTTQHPRSLVDRVIDNAEQFATVNGEAERLPASLSGDDPAFPMTKLGYAADTALPAWRVARSMDGDQTHAMMHGQSMLTPDGQLLAYVDYRDGIASLNLRPAMTEAEPWVAFTTDERILHLQWSPLDAGILMTVGHTAENKERASYLRLMLLDLETLTVQELYRRDLPAEGWSGDIGNLT